jgi:hypothetical protein
MNSFIMSRVLGAICERSASSGEAKFVIQSSVVEKKDPKLPSPPEKARWLEINGGGTPSAWFEPFRK